MLRDVEQRLTEARTALVLAEPFFGQLALRLEFVEDRAAKGMRVDGKVLKVNPDYVMDLSVHELRGMVAHAVMRCAMGHPARRGTRTPALWDRAGALAVNGELLKAGFILPKTEPHEDRFDGQSAESIYATLAYEQPQDQQQGGGKQQPQAGQQSQGQGQGGQPGQPGQGEPGCGVDDLPGQDGGTASEAEMGANEREWQVAVAQAAQSSRAAGKLPGEHDRMAQAAVKSKTDWRHRLGEFCTSASRTESTWSRPNRRMVARGVYMPSNKPTGLGLLDFHIDISGSVNQRQLDMFNAEVNKVAEDAAPERVRVIYWDTKVRRVDTYEADEFPIKLSAKGGGGTDPRAGFTWVEHSGEQPDAAVVLTDLDFNGRWPVEPSYPLLWAATGRITQAPYGEVVRID